MPVSCGADGLSSPAGGGALPGGRASRPIAACLYALLVIVPAAASAARAGTPTASFSLTSPAVSVSFQYVKREILVKGTIAGRPDRTLLLDTGAGLCVVDRSLGVRGADRSAATMEEAGGQSAAEALTLDEIGVGDSAAEACAAHIRVLVVDLSGLSSAIGQRLDGIVGSTFLAGFQERVDYKAREVKFSRAGGAVPAAPPGSFEMPLTPADPFLSDGNQIVRGALGSADCGFLLDTGFDGFASVGQNMAERAGLMEADVPRMQWSAAGVSRALKLEKVRAPELRIGPIDLSGSVIDVDRDPDSPVGNLGIAGNRMLENFALILDIKRHILVLQPAGDRILLADWPAFGLQLADDNGEVRVDQVGPQSAASRAGIQAGDRILAVESRDVSRMPASAIADMLDNEDGPTTVELQRHVDPNLGTGGDTYTTTLGELPPALPVAR